MEGRLVPWVHYAPVRPDFKDLKEVVEWLKRNDAYAKRIGDVSE